MVYLTMPEPTFLGVEARVVLQILKTLDQWRQLLAIFKWFAPEEGMLLHFLQK